MRACVDLGHGGTDSGAVGPTGLKESMVVLRLGPKVCEKLRERGQLSFLTRENNTSLTPARRLRLANGHPVDVVLSLHCNASDRAGANGFEVWTSPGDTGADVIATQIWGAISARMPELTGRTDFSTTVEKSADADREAHFYILTETKPMAVLVECAFISNPTDEARLRDDQFLERMAEALAEGLVAGYQRAVAAARSGVGPMGQIGPMGRGQAEAEGLKGSKAEKADSTRQDARGEGQGK